MKVASQKNSIRSTASRRAGQHAAPCVVESLESRRLFAFSNGHLFINDPIFHGPIPSAPILLLEPKISVTAAAPTGLSQQFTITNTGTAPLTLNSPPTLRGFTQSDPDYPSFLSPNAQSIFATYPPFSITTAPSTAPIAPGGSTTFVVTFSDANASRSIVFPSSNTITTDIDFGAAISINSNDPQSPNLVPNVTASYGIVPYASLPKLRASGHESKIVIGNGNSTGNQNPSIPFTISENASELSDQQYIHFGTLTAGSAAAQSALVFANNGADTLNFALAGNGSGFTASDPITSVAPGKNAAISIIPSVNAPGAITGSVSLTVTDPAKNLTQKFTLFVDGQVTPPASAPAFTSPGSAVFLAGATNSFTITTTGFPAPAITAKGTLPAGLTLKDNGDGTATLSGIPTGPAGALSLQFAAANGVGAAAQTFTLTLNAKPQFTSASSAALTVGTAGTFNILTSGFPAAVITASSGLPKGITLNKSGQLVGTPTTTGTYKFTLTATNTLASVTQIFTLTVNPLLATNKATPTLKPHLGVN